ncbi:MAG: tetratricopeptide repeat protein [Myxococcaceae bacterium]|nr:tetratricopeptide repeat protein [Myxococcaceae bacterium]
MRFGVVSTCGLVMLLGAGCLKAVPPLTPMELAESHLHQGNPAKAIALLEPLYLVDRQDLAIGRALAQAHVKNGTADTFLKQLAAPATAADHYLRGLLLFSRSADASAPAISEFSKAVALKPDVAEFHYRLGLALLESERYEDALVSLHTAVQQAPQQRGWLLPLAKALHRAGQPEKAIAAIRDFVSGPPPSRQELATARALMDSMTDPFARIPQAARATFETGLTELYQRDQPQAAIISFEMVAKDHPDLGVVHTLLGLSHQRLGDAGRALDELKRAVELSPSDGKNHLYLAGLFSSHQRPETAREHLLKAIELHPLLDDAYAQLGDLALERNDLPAAEQAFRTWVAIAPDSLNARGKLALVYQQQGDWPAAENQLQAALEKEPENIEFVLRMGVLHADRFQKARTPQEKQAASETARVWLKRVLDAQPDNTIASRALQTLPP